jgi:NADPH2:quinone reductase
VNRDARSAVRKASPGREVLTIGIMPDPTPAQGDVRIRITASGINPGDVKKRQSAFGYGMPYPRVIPHSDGARYIDLVGEGVAADWIGRRVWCYGAQSYRPWGPAAEYTVAPVQLGSALYSWPVVRVPR